MTTKFNHDDIIRISSEFHRKCAPAFKKTEKIQECSDRELQELRKDFVELFSQMEKIITLGIWDDDVIANNVWLFKSHMEALIPDEWRTRNWRTTPFAPQELKFMAAYTNAKDVLEDLKLKRVFTNIKEILEDAEYIQISPSEEQIKSMLKCSMSQDPETGTIKLRPINDDNHVVIRGATEAIFLINKLTDFILEL